MNSMPRPSTPGSLMTSSTAKENKPAWCSSGHPRSTLRTGKGKPLEELKSANRGGPTGGGQPVNAEKSLSAKKAPSLQQDNPGSLTGRRKGKASLSSRVVAILGAQYPAPVVGSSLDKITTAPVTDETPPRSRPLKKTLSTLVTPTNKLRKANATFGNPQGGLPKCSTPKTNGSTPKGSAPKGISPSSLTREKCCPRTKETPTRRIKERPAAGVVGQQEIPKLGSKDKTQHPFSTWPCSAAVKTRKASPIQGRAAVKHLFLSPQGAKKTAKKDPLRKSIDNQGRWIGSVLTPRRRAAEEKREMDSEMPPPAQPTNSPEIPKRSSREASGEDFREYFGAGPMVAPEGMGFVRDRRKCKPRGTLMVGDKGLSMDSDSSSGAVESSVQIPLPSAASIEWMMNNNALENLNDVSSTWTKHGTSTSLSDLIMQENQARESLRNERTSQEFSSEGLFLQQLRPSRPNGGDINYHRHANRSQALLQLLRQSQLGIEGSVPHTSSHSLYKSGDGFLRRAERQDVNDVDSEHQDITIDWRRGLRCESMEMTGSRASQEVGKNEDVIRSSISFTSSCPPPLEQARRLSENSRTCHSSDSSWYGFSPITPEFHLNSQLSEGASNTVDALVAGSVRRRIVTDQSGSSEKLDSGSSSSLAESMQLVNADDPAISPSAHNAHYTCSSFLFAARNSYASSSPVNLGSVPLDTSVCHTSSPIDQSQIGEDFVCQIASPLDVVHGAHCGVNGNVDCTIDCRMACSIDCSVGCSVECSVDASLDDRWDDALESDDEVEYASPIMRHYLSPPKRTSPSARCELGDSDLTSCGEVVNMGPRAGRRSSISRTLEELMRHNFTL